VEECDTSINITSRDRRVLYIKIKPAIFVRYLVRIKIKTQIDVAEKVALSLLERIAFSNQLKAISGYY
jgi:hypothetical protein